MKAIKQTGLVLFLLGLAIFIGTIFTGSFSLKQAELDTFLKEQNYKSEVIGEALQKAVVTTNDLNIFQFSNAVRNAYAASNNHYDNLIKKYDAEKNWDEKGKQFQYKISGKPHSLSFSLAKSAGKGPAPDSTGLMWFLTFGLAIIGALMYIVPDVILLGKPGIKNNGIFLNAATNRGWIGWFAFIFLVTFYILLYFFPDYIVNWVYLVDPISKSISGNPASQWFLYGFLYCTVMSVMAVRMYIKYRHNKYQILRTTSVLFFQIVFAFLIPEILVRFEKPWYDFKNAFPLDYDFFFRWNLEELLASGAFGLFILVWGVVLTIIVVPVMVYFFGKRWYCSWVCGCGGLAETLGDPYRQLSSKTLLSWRVERIIIHSVLIFVLVMTGFALYTFFSGEGQVLGIKTQTIQDIYGFLIGSIFAGVIGTGFYPIFGNRVWCRFGCPLAAYLGFVQRFKSRFRITTN